MRIDGRLTARGSDRIEALLADILSEVTDRVRATIPDHERVALVLHGGYGRGEGGVDRTGGREVPHNNLDLLLVTRRRPTAELRERLHRVVAPVAHGASIGIDVGAIPASALASAPHLVMWHDMFHAHRTLLGDTGFVPSLVRFSGPDIAPWDVRNLLSNRATLLLLAGAVLDGRAMDEALRRSVVRHVVKAIIGVGDACLFFHGRYHHHYAVKQTRMRTLESVPAELRALYEEAIEFRFEPAYERLLGKHPDLAGWASGITRLLAPVHLDCERIRLGRPKLSWGDYLERAFSHALVEGPWTARACAKRISTITTTRRRTPERLSAAARLGARLVDGRSLLAIILPAVLHDLPAPTLAIAAEILEAPARDREALRRAYLRGWGREGDTNFAGVARDLGLDEAA